MNNVTIFACSLSRDSSNLINMKFQRCAHVGVPVSGRDSDHLLVDGLGKVDVLGVLRRGELGGEVVSDDVDGDLRRGAEGRRAQIGSHDGQLH